MIPVRPSAFDLAAVPAAVEIVAAAKVRGAFVLSACPFRAPEIGRRARRWKPTDPPIVPGEITDRRAFARAVTTGSAVTEFEAEGGSGETGLCGRGSKITLERK